MNSQQSELHEGAQTGKFCKRQSLIAKLGITVNRDRTRHKQPVSRMRSAFTKRMKCFEAKHVDMFNTNKRLLIHKNHSLELLPKKIKKPQNIGYH